MKIENSNNRIVFESIEELQMFVKKFENLTLKKDEFDIEVMINDDKIDNYSVEYLQSLTDTYKKAYMSIEAKDINSDGLLDMLKQKLNRIQLESEELSRAFYLNRELGIWDKLMTIIGKLDTAFMLIDLLIFSNQENISEYFDIKKFKDSVESTNFILVKLIGSLKSRDTVSVGDSLKWELAPQMDVMIDLINHSKIQGGIKC